MLLPEIKKFRYERKFYIESLTLKEVETIIKKHPAIFSEIYRRRFVNNIYFDSFDKKHYFDNINGLSKRLKVRIRWYGDLFGFVASPFLEVKTKHNLHVGKLSYALPSFCLDNKFSLKDIREIFVQARLPATVKQYVLDLSSLLLNRYQRKYFLSSDHQYRLTLDADLEFYRLSYIRNTFLHKIKDPRGIVLELKYVKSGDESASSVTSCFPFRMTRNSKYVAGIDYLGL